MSQSSRTVYPGPVEVTVSESGVVVRSLAEHTESVSIEERTVEVGPKGHKRKLNVPFDADYSTRKGFDGDFLGGGVVVGHPDLSPALRSEVTNLLDSSGKRDKGKWVLDYHNYSVVMHYERKFAVYSAANVDCAGRFLLGRGDDTWRVDPRIPRSAQIENSLYAPRTKGGRNQFDRGHLTRYEDLEFGATAKAAVQSADDTCHWTNCVPQHERFNRSRQLWQGIERYLLEKRIEKADIKAQVFTGPVFAEDDPEFMGVQYPLQFWKVVAALDADDKLYATAYLLDQTDVIDEYGIEKAKPYFGSYKTFQVAIEEVERLTGLTFTYDQGGKKHLRDVDPMKTRPRRRGRRSSVVVHESASVGGVSAGPYHELNELEGIWLG